MRGTAGVRIGVGLKLLRRKRPLQNLAGAPGEQIDELGAAGLALQVEARNGYRQMETPRARTSRIDAKYALLLLLYGYLENPLSPAIIKGSTIEYRIGFGRPPALSCPAKESAHAANELRGSSGTKHREATEQTHSPR